METEETLLRIDSIGFSERELKLLSHCKHYEADAFGAPNHALMVLVAKLAKIVEKKAEFKSDHWSSL